MQGNSVVFEVDHLHLLKKKGDKEEKVSVVKHKSFHECSHVRRKEVLNLQLCTAAVKKIPVSGDLLTQKAETLALCMNTVVLKLGDASLWNLKEKKRRYDLVLTHKSASVD